MNKDTVPGPECGKWEVKDPSYTEVYDKFCPGAIHNLYVTELQMVVPKCWIPLVPFYGIL